MDKLPLVNILIVEDDGKLLQILKFVLEDAGYKVVEATTGAEALEQVAAEPVDLVVIDVDMAGMSGLDVARQLRAATTTSHVLIALHTGLDEDIVREEFADYDLFMPKVDDTDALLRMVAGVLAKRRIASPGEEPVPAVN